MIKGHPEVCLFRPEIPQNAGNVGRLCAATQCRLHLVTPFGFKTDDKNLRRAGLDYWPFLDLEVHDHLDPLISRFGTRFAFFSTRGKKTYKEMPVDTELLIFGQETKGLPQEILDRWSEHAWRIPMFHTGVRSLNVANVVSIVLYDLLLKRREVLGITTTL